MSDDENMTQRYCSDCKRYKPVEEFEGGYKTCCTCRESSKGRKREDESCNKKFNYKSLFNSYKMSDPEFSIKLEDFVEMVISKCTYCGHRDLSKGYIGIDRVDSNMGHIEGNCVACCWTCNRMKGDMDVHEWIAHMNRIVEYCKKNNHFQ